MNGSGFVFMLAIAVAFFLACNGGSKNGEDADAGIEADASADGDEGDALEDIADDEDAEDVTGDAPGECTLDEDLFPTYEGNAVRWISEDYKQNFPSVAMVMSIDGLTVTLSGQGEAPGGEPIVGCGYHFGDSTPAVEVEVDDRGNCPEREHTYAQAGGDTPVLMVWTGSGLFGQATDLALAGVGSIPDWLMDNHDVFIGPPECANEDRCEQSDGCLWAHYWLPSEGEPPFPAIVNYSCYQIEGGFGYMEGAFLASGMAVVRVTNRGQLHSCGPADMFGATAQADLQVIDAWLDEQEWATGKYCLIGHSGPGLMGTLSAAGAPPNLKCALLGGQDTDLYQRNATKSGGWWPFIQFWHISTYGPAAIVPELAEERIPTLVDHLTAFHSRTFTDYFGERDRAEQLRGLDIPIFFETSWEDVTWGSGPNGGPYFDVVSDMPHAGSAMIIYPGPHASFDPSNERTFRTIPDHDMLAVSEVRDFLHAHLLGDGTGSTDDFTYMYFRQRGGPQAALMNRIHGGWHTSDTWPPPGVSLVVLYLTADASNTITSRLDSGLSAAPPPDGELGPFGYGPPIVWDTVIGAKPVPFPFYTFPDLREQEQAGITFTTAPLETDAVVEGPARLVLPATTDLYDFDWMALLSDVWPDGSSHRISFGVMRASLRNDMSLYEPAPEGEQAYNIELSSLSNVFEAGHRIRLSLFQLNTTDATPADAATTVRLGEAGARLELYAEGGAIEAGDYPGCAAFDPSATAAHSLEPFMKWYVTGGLRGTDPEHPGVPVGFGFYGRHTIDGAASGYVFYDFLPVGFGALVVKGMGPAEDSAWDYDMALESLDTVNHYTMSVRCPVEEDPGTLILEGEGLVVGPVNVQDGMIHCYDVPFVNFNGSDH